MTNTLAYYDVATITIVKSFIVQAEGLEWPIATNDVTYYDTELITTVKSFIVETVGVNSNESIVIS
jgi:hypothetical protein